MHDILNRKDIEVLIDLFYNKVRSDAMLAPVFSHVDWPNHLPTMHAFWASLLFGEQSYRGNPFQSHMKLPLTADHFERWLELFTETVTGSFKGPKADEAVERARNIAALFQHRMQL